MSDRCVVVFTGESVESIVRRRGTAAWHLDRRHARECDFVVCTRNTKPEWAEGSEAHRSAFLIGKIDEVVPVPNRDGRYVIQLSEYASLNIPNLWKGQNPVKYATLKELGIDPATLKWKRMPKEDEKPEPMGTAGPPSLASALTMDEAKRGLALTFGVSPDAIEITIRG
jgi:hypothetical protein